MDPEKLAEMLIKSSNQKLQEFIELSKSPNEFLAEYFTKVKAETNSEIDKIADPNIDRGQIRDAILKELEKYEKQLLSADKKSIANQSAISDYQTKIDKAFVKVTKKNQQAVCLDYTKMITNIESDIYELKRKLMDNRTFYLHKDSETGLIHLVHIEDCYLSEDEVVLLKYLFDQFVSNFVYFWFIWAELNIHISLSRQTTWSYDLNSTHDMNLIFEVNPRFLSI